ncbi:MAG: hypothetical protein SFX74_09445 [Fimbriimonadaceae bacterium]|nr:hypothetical protein [Fimbriimonadaceae bacterium]
MIIPDYIPEPLEVPGNVHDGPYAERVTFNRRVALTFTGCVGAAALVSQWLPQSDRPAHEMATNALAGPCFVAWCGLLALLRIEYRGTQPETRAMSLSLPITGTLFGWLLATYPALMAIPVGSAVFCAVLLLSGRDFSHPFGAVVTALAVGAMHPIIPHAPEPGRWWALVILGVTYFTFDFWCLAYRRRADEPIAAAHDLFRDYLNILGYVVRVIRHWRRHRLWQDLPPR